MGRPSFLIIGSERCGTTSLYENIFSHSMAKAPSTKEIEFFDRYYEKGLDWYESQFPDGITGEATPTYCWNPRVPGRILETYGDSMKIIWIRRDPVEASYSKWWQQVSKGVEKMSLKDSIRAERVRIKGELERTTELPFYYPSLYVEHSYIHRYRYVEHKVNWTAFNVLHINLEDLVKSPDSVMAEVFEYIGLPYEQHDWVHANPGGAPPLSPQDRQILEFAHYV